MAERMTDFLSSLATRLAGTTALVNVAHHLSPEHISIVSHAERVASIDGTSDLEIDEWKRERASLQAASGKEAGQPVAVIGFSGAIDTEEFIRQLKERAGNDSLHLAIISKDVITRELTRKSLILDAGEEAVLKKAASVFGDFEAVARWLDKKSMWLDDRTPKELLKTEQGARLVEAYLDQIEHGVYA